MANGIAYCTMVSDVAIDNGYAYEWMAGYFDDFGKQDKKRTLCLFSHFALRLTPLPD